MSCLHIWLTKVCSFVRLVGVGRSVTCVLSSLFLCTFVLISIVSLLCYTLARYTMVLLHLFPECVSACGTPGNTFSCTRTFTLVCVTRSDTMPDRHQVSGQSPSQASGYEQDDETLKLSLPGNVLTVPCGCPYSLCFPQLSTKYSTPLPTRTFL